MNTIIQRLVERRSPASSARDGGPVFDLDSQPVCDQHLKLISPEHILAMQASPDECVICQRERTIADRAFVERQTWVPRIQSCYPGVEIGLLRVYLAGLLDSKGNLEENRQPFFRMEAMLQRFGFGVACPARQPVGRHYHWYIEQGIKDLLCCHAVVMLKRWRESKGAKLEHQLAKMTGRPVFYER